MSPKRRRKGQAKVSTNKETVQDRERIDKDLGTESVNDLEDVGSEDGGSETGKRKDQKCYSFGAADENRLVEFFEAHDCFYNKLNEKYANTQYKNRLLKEIAADLLCDASKVIGWFKNQRSAIGKLLKKKSGQAAQTLTSRSKWQLSAFHFLSDHIRPRTYPHDTGMPYDEDDEPADVSLETSAAASPSEQDLVPSTLSTAGNSTRGSRKARTSTRIDEALLKFLSQPRESQQIVKKMEESAGPEGERERFILQVVQRKSAKSARGTLG